LYNADTMVAKSKRERVRIAHIAAQKRWGDGAIKATAELVESVAKARLYDMCPKDVPWDELLAAVRFVIEARSVEAAKQYVAGWRWDSSDSLATFVKVARQAARLFVNGAPKSPRSPLPG
jgi:hypothetical protein